MTDENVKVEFIDPESAIDILDGVAVAAKTKDGAEAVGIMIRFRPKDGTRTMVQILNVVSNQLILATDIRNFAEIVVP